MDQREDVQFLGEHYKLLLYTGAGVSRAVETHPKNAGSTVESEVWLTSQVGAALAQAKDLLLGRGIAPDPGLEGDVEVPLQVVQLLLDGIKEHEPTLAAALDGPGGWTEQCQRFQGFQHKLIEQARGLLNQRGAKEVAPYSVADAAVQALVQREKEEIFGGRVLSGPPSPDAAETADDHWVSEQTSAPGRLSDLRKSGARVAATATRVEKAVIELPLKGRPGGRCSLCPSRGGAYALGS